MNITRLRADYTLYITGNTADRNKNGTHDYIDAAYAFLKKKGYIKNSKASLGGIEIAAQKFLEDRGLHSEIGNGTASGKFFQAIAEDSVEKNGRAAKSLARKI